MQWKFLYKLFDSRFIFLAVHLLTTSGDAECIMCYLLNYMIYI